MLDIGNLNFKVSTVELEQAARKILELGAAIQALEATQKTASQVQKETSKLERQAIKDAAALAALKLKLAEAEAKAAAAANGTNNANRQQLSDADKLTKLLERLNSTYLNMADGLSRGESNILQMARSLGATDIQLQQVRASLQQIAGLSSSPFDSSLGSLRAIQKEMDALNDRSRLAAQGIFLTTKQLQEYSRLGNEIRGQMSAQNIDHTQGAGATEFTRRLAEEQAKYLGIANSVNTVTAAEKARNDVLNAQKNILAGIETENTRIQASINRNAGITSGMQAGASQSRASTTYDNATRLAGAGTPEQTAKIREQIDLTNKLKESERLLNIEVEKQNELVRHIEGLVAQRKAMDDLNKSITDNVAERTRMDALMKKYKDLGFNSSFAAEISKAEMKGASQASIDSLKNYALGVQAAELASRNAATAADALRAANERMARDAAQSRYVTAGASNATAGRAAGMEQRGVPQSVIDSFIQEATAKERAAKASRELASANKFIIDTEERLAQAVSNANQNLNRQSTDELAKYQRALATVGTTTDETTRKMAALKAQLDLVAGKERANQLNHLSRAISTQMGDVGISLASGMNPLTVMLQQGDQIRFALMQAGAEGKELEVAMAGAARQIATSVATTVSAMGAFVAGTFKSIAAAVYAPIAGVKSLIAELAALKNAQRIGFIDASKYAEEVNKAWAKMGAGFATWSNLLKGGIVIALAALAVAFFQVIAQERELSNAIVNTGASLGYSKESALALADSMNGVTTTVAIEAITAFASASVKGSESTEKMMKAAIDLEKYGGQAVAETAKQYAALQGEPMKALQDIAEASGRVTVATLEKAKAYSDAGDRAKLLALAESETARVTDEKAKAMQGSLAPIQQLWIEIKHSIAAVWDEIKGLTRSGPIVDGLRAVFQTVAVIATEVWFSIKEIAGSIAALPAMGQAAFSDIKNLDTGFTETRRMAGVIKQAGDDNRAAYDKAIASIMKTGEAAKTVASQSAKQLQTNTQTAKTFGIAAAAEEKYLSTVNRLLRERANLEGQYKKAQSQGAAGDPSAKRIASAMSELDKRIKDAKESEAKKGKGKGPAKASFSGVPSDVSLENNTANIQREYSSAFSKAEKLGKFQRDILKLNFDADLISRGEYVGKDIKLIVEAEQKKLEVIAEYGKQELAEYEKVSKAIAARKADALNATKDPKSRQKIELDSADALRKLTEAHEAFQEIQKDRTEVTRYEAIKRSTESLKEQTATMREAKKEIEDLNKAMSDASEARRIEAEYQWNAIKMSGVEEASYKARTEALKQYSKVISGLEIKATKAEQDHAAFTANMGFDGESITKAFQLWQQSETLKSQVVQAGIDSETASRKAGVDAFNKYYMDKAIEVRDGTAGAIAEGIMNGGKAGSDAIKNVLNNVINDLLNKVFKSVLGSVGDMIAQSISGASQQSSGGGGIFQTLLGTGLSALFGGAFGGAGASAATSQYSLAGGSTDMTSGFKMRAVGGFVNKGSEYTVGENGPEKFIPKQAGTIVPNHKLNSGSSTASADPMKVTIINNTSSAIGKVTERQISPTERALIIEEAVMAGAAQWNDPNSKTSKSFNNNYRLQRNR